MNETLFYHILLWMLLISAPINGVWLCYHTAPYGRHPQAGWGPKLPNWLGWVMMECPTLLVMLYWFSVGSPGSVAYVFLGLWLLHYLYRTLIFPFRLRDPYATMPLAIPIAGVLVTFSVTYVNGYALTVMHSYALSWLADPRFIVGVGVFFVGWIINQTSDAILLRLRKDEGSGYQIPYGGLFRWISCPNYLGEILEWCGWAIATWSLAGLAFALWTISTLVPRALDHHRWYLQRFPDYPKNRWAIFYRVL